MSDTPDLLPCPFCGGPATGGWFAADYDIDCRNCGFSINEHIGDYNGSEAQAKAAVVARWNTRTPDAALKAERARADKAEAERDALAVKLAKVTAAYRAETMRRVAYSREAFVRHIAEITGTP